MKKTNHYEHFIRREELEVREEEGRLDNLFIVFEEDEEDDDRYYDLSHGIIEGLENAKAFADEEMKYSEYDLYVANYKDWLDGSYDYLYELKK